MTNNHTSSDMPNILNPNCGSRRVLDLIADKWTILVIYALNHGTKRPSQLQREIGGISQKMLIQSLRNLQEHGIVQRSVYSVMPPMVEYDLTPLGKSLVGMLATLCHWAEEHWTELRIEPISAEEDA